MDRITSLPREVFIEITDRLPLPDLSALLSVSRTVHSMAEPALYRSITIKSKPTFTGLARALTAKPHLRDMVRSFAVGRSAPWWSLDLLSSFTSLQEFEFEMDSLEQKVYMIEELARGGWIRPTLKRCR